MTHLLLSTLGLPAVLFAGTAAPQRASADHRAGCPGQIVCPQTGRLVCRDRCPLAPAAEKTAEKAAPVRDCGGR